MVDGDMTIWMYYRNWKNKNKVDLKEGLVFLNYKKKISLMG